MSNLSLNLVHSSEFAPQPLSRWVRSLRFCHLPYQGRIFPPRSRGQVGPEGAYIGVSRPAIVGGHSVQGGVLQHLHVAVLLRCD
jgi:hypothetical protein